MDLQSIMTKIKYHTPSVLGHEQFMKSAVLLPLIQKDNELHVLFEVRAESMRRQPGEICFPGGRIDPQDRDVCSAAIRETTEELGIGSEAISNVYPLDYMVTPFGMIVYPHTGLITLQGQLQPNPSEVGELFSVPLSFFLENEPDIHHVHLQVQPDASFPVELIPGGENYNWRTSHINEYFYIYGDRVIWGLTARILSHFIDMIR
ncbi:NUDIX hydrolase [Lentibacillus amyloliquefaciens]|uniref:Coenzyme A pyrophosphatase n=1 Tax=Lentibacillus amyloliquefaciens TaxID=1472767 RepID=A0A0U4FLQ4_9BACI|nr:CoA pyrophosphatase [Lentibacillus amyloliquefaciens]ALX49598.1 coenzyme A pyrophosphatase [Lentibacillus amyloliquefaciens]